MTYRLYDVTIHYLTPGNRPGDYTDRVMAETSQEAERAVQRFLSLEPRRKVARITGRTVAIVDWFNP